MSGAVIFETVNFEAFGEVQDQHRAIHRAGAGLDAAIPLRLRPGVLPQREFPRDSLAPPVRMNGAEPGIEERSAAPIPELESRQRTVVIARGHQAGVRDPRETIGEIGGGELAERRDTESEQFVGAARVIAGVDLDVESHAE